MEDCCFVAIDWGTTSFRLWSIDAAGTALAEHKESCGMSTLSPSEYGPILESTLANLGVGPSVPVLICGMAGAAQGWQEARYLDVPTQLDSLADNAVRVNCQNRDIRILPGLAQRQKNAPDVMRGEETLLLGAMEIGQDFGTYCMPGTHSKWVHMKDGEVREFRTFMTGELFALLSSGSTLSHFIDNSEGDVTTQRGFREGIMQSTENPDTLTNMLFSLRAGPLLFPDDLLPGNAARLSGLLIGAELAGARTDKIGPVGLIADPMQAKIYGSAFEALGIAHKIIDSNHLALAGLTRTAKSIWPHIHEEGDRT